MKDEVAVQYFEKLHELHDDLSFLPDRLKLVKVGKLQVNLHDKTEYNCYTHNKFKTIIKQ